MRCEIITLKFTVNSNSIDSLKIGDVLCFEFHRVKIHDIKYYDYDIYRKNVVQIVYTDWGRYTRDYILTTATHIIREVHREKKKSIYTEVV